MNEREEPLSLAARDEIAQERKSQEAVHGTDDPPFESLIDREAREAAEWEEDDHEADWLAQEAEDAARDAATPPTAQEVADEYEENRAEIEHAQRHEML